jgi:hypothetical protein
MSKLILQLLIEIYLYLYFVCIALYVNLFNEVEQFNLMQSYIIFNIYLKLGLHYK